MDVVRFGGVESESNYTRYRVCHDDNDDCWFSISRPDLSFVGDELWVENWDQDQTYLMNGIDSAQLPERKRLFELDRIWTTPLQSDNTQTHPATPSTDQPTPLGWCCWWFRLLWFEYNSLSSQSMQIKCFAKLYAIEWESRNRCTHGMGYKGIRVLKGAGWIVLNWSGGGARPGNDRKLWTN